MAAAVTVETVKIVINDVELEVPKGELIVESVKRIGEEIPIFCYHPRMKPVGMCRMCLVEVGFKQPDGSVRKMPKPQAGCTLPASDGMVIYTDTEMVHRDRKGVLEFLLVNHPLDCPICDRGGECPLQNNTLFYGPSTSRFIEVKRHQAKAFPLSKYVTLDLERCIQCGRCVRFTEEISGDSQLAFRFRGAEMAPSTFDLTNFESKFSGNVIEICPVGALTSSVYRFRARPWDLETKPSICTLCPNHCNVWFDYRASNFVRINGRTNEAINEEWTCDKGKFGHDFYNSPKRLTVPLRREANGFQPVRWADIYEDVIGTFKDSSVAGLVGGTVSNEGLFLFQKLFRGTFGSSNIDHRWTKHLPDAAARNLTHVGVTLSQSPIATFETAARVLLFGTDLAAEQPMVHLRVRKGWFNAGTKVIVAHHAATDADSFAHLVLRYKPGTEDLLAMALLKEIVGHGKSSVPAPTLDELNKLSLDDASAKTGVTADRIRAAAAIIAEGAQIVTTQHLFDANSGLEAHSTLAGMAMVTGGAFSCYAAAGNDQAAADLGVLPDAVDGKAGKNTHQILEACARGEIKALWLLECDPFALHPDRALVTQALENVDYLVYQGNQETEAMGYASVVLPTAATSEFDGSYENIERRVQRVKAVIPAPGEAKAAWQTLQEIMVRATPSRPFFSANEVLAEIAKTVPGWESVTPDKLAAEGFVQA